MNQLIAELLSKGFCLSGSRRMAEKYPEKIKITDSTDYDFYCPESQENRDFLAAKGFYKVDCHNKNYWDTLLVDIFKHNKYNIEVLIRKNVPLYQMAFESIGADTFYYRLWKSCPEIGLENRSAFSASVCAYFSTLFDVYRNYVPIEDCSFNYDDGIPF